MRLCELYSGWILASGHMFEPQRRKEIARLHAAAAKLIQARLGPDGSRIKDIKDRGDWLASEAGPGFQLSKSRTSI